MPSKRSGVSRVNDGFNAPATAARSGRQQALVARYSFSGPLPPADELEKYNLVVPGMAERLLLNLEKQTDRRIDIEKKVIEGDIRRADRGLGRFR